VGIRRLDQWQLGKTKKARPTWTRRIRDDPAFFYGGDEDNDCAHVAAKPSRCDDSDNNDGERTAREACAKTCGTCPTPGPTASEEACADDASWYYDNDEDRDCEHVAANAGSRCDADNTNEEGVSRRSCVWCAGKDGLLRGSTPRTTGRRSGRRSRARRRPGARWSSTRWVCGTRWRTIARRGSQT